MLIYKKKKKKIKNYLIYLKESVRKKIIIFYILIIATNADQINKNNMINEVIEEEDEYKNNKENENYKENININNKNNENNNKLLKDNNIEIQNLKNIKEINNKNKQNLIWCSSPINKKVNTLQNITSKKTFDKYISIRDKLIVDNKNNNKDIILPDLNKIKNKNINFDNFKSLNLKNPFNPKKMNLRSISIDKTKFQQNININSITNDTTAFTHSSKKYYSPIGMRNQNFTEDLSKFRMGLLSAGTTSNNNIIIPMIPISRPVSNFNFGGGQLLNHFENNNNINNKNIIKKDNIINEDINNIMNINNNLKKEEDENNFDIEFNKIGLNMNYNNSTKNKSNNGSRNKLIKSQNIKKPYKDIKNDMNMNNYLDIDKILGRLHKIKIEKGMMNSSIVNSLNTKFNSDYHNHIEQFKKSHLPRMFNIQNNNKISKTVDLNNNYLNKNNSKRSLSFNNKNNNH